MSDRLERLKERRRAWAADPLMFVRDVFRVTPDPWQVQALQHFNDKPKVALRMSKGTGKSTFEAWIGWWFLTTRWQPNAAATSISGDNLQDGLWKELAVWRNRSDLIKGEFELTTQAAFLRKSPETWFLSARTWPKDADPEKQAETLAGLHAKSVLYLIDESGSIPRAVVAAAEGALSTGGDVHLVQAGNSTDVDGPLYDACTSQREHYYVVEVSGDPDDPNRSSRVDLAWAKGLIDQYGREHPFVKVNVLNEFPNRAQNKWIGFKDVEDASKRGVPMRDFMNEPKVLGVDVSAGGANESVIQPRQGPVAFKCETELGQPDTMKLVAHVCVVADMWGREGGTVAAIFVDGNGVGRGVADRLRELGYPAHVVDSAEESHRQEVRFFNLRAQMWWDMADWIRRGSIPNDPTLRKQLQDPRYSTDVKGRYKLETKEEMRKRGVDSPDRADALAYTFAMPVQPVAMRKVQATASPPASHCLTDFDPLASVDRPTGREPQAYAAAPQFNPFAP